MDIIILPLLDVLLSLISLYKWVVIISVISSWLIAFGIINTYSKFVATALDVLYKITEPVLRPIRKILPSFAGLDLSPIVLIFVLHLFQTMILRVILRFGVM